MTEKVGNIRKCPACGEPVESFQTRCSGCGHEFSGVKAADSVRGFFDKITEISEQDDVKETDKKGNDKKIKAFHGMLIGLFIMNIIINSVWMNFTLIAASIALALVIGLIMFTRKVAFSAADNTKKNLITNFPIPNAKEDLLEFMILSSSQITSAHGLSYTARKQQAWNNIWIVKCRQVFSKAEILFASDKQSLEIVRNNQNKVEKIIASEKNLKTAVVALIVILLVIAAGKIVMDNSGILIKVPEQAVIAPENIYFGAFVNKDIVKITSVVLNSSQGGTVVDAEIEFEALDDFRAVVERKVREEVERRNWNWDDCTWRFVSTHNNKILDGDIDDINLYSSNGPDLLDIQKGGKYTLLFTSGYSNKAEDDTAMRKRLVAQYMALQKLTFGYSNADVIITHKPPNYGEKERDLATIEF